MPLTADAIAKQALAIRDKMDRIKEGHKKDLAPYEHALALLTNAAQQLLDDNGVLSMRTDEGTFYKETLFTASVENKSLFHDFVLNTRATDMLTANLSKDAVQSYVDAHNEPPPGVKVGGVIKVKFRHPT